MWPNPQFPADLSTFTEEILNGKLNFLCSVNPNVTRLKMHMKQVYNLRKTENN